ncbi:MAG: DUF192 domain-containing protein [Gammaproteobacteria bacterium]
MLLAILLPGFAARAEDGPQELPSIELGLGIHLIQAQVALTPAQRTVGLMFRKSMPANDGMLFVFEQAREHCFWMKDTLLPLSAAFIADDGTIVNIEDMVPGTLDRHCSAQPVRFVLELNQGWFDQRGITAGARLRGATFGER